MLTSATESVLLVCAALPGTASRRVRCALMQPRQTQNWPQQDMELSTRAVRLSFSAQTKEEEVNVDGGSDEGTKVDDLD